MAPQPRTDCHHSTSGPNGRGRKTFSNLQARRSLVPRLAQQSRIQILVVILALRRKRDGFVSGFRILEDLPS